MGALLVPHCCLQLLDNLKDIMQHSKGVGHLCILSRPGHRRAVCVVEVLSCHSIHSSCLWRLSMPLCCTTNPLLQSSNKLLVDEELKHLHPQMLVGFNMFKSCSCRELLKVLLAIYFSGQFSKINIDSLKMETVNILLRFVSPITVQHISSHRHKYTFTQTFDLLVTSLSDTVWGAERFP